MSIPKITINKNTVQLAKEEEHLAFKKAYVTAQKALMDIIEDAEEDEKRELIELMRDLSKNKREYLAG